MCTRCLTSWVSGNTWARFVRKGGGDEDARRELSGGVFTSMIGIGDAEEVTSEAWREHSSELLAFATVLVGPADAGDVVAEALQRAAPALDAGRVADVRAYLFRAVVNHAHNLRRARRRRWARDLAAVRPTTVDAPDTHVDVRRAVAALTVTQRAVVYLAYWHDLPEREIAAELDMSAGTVHRHLTAARDRLRKALG